MGHGLRRTLRAGRGRRLVLQPGHRGLEFFVGDRAGIGLPPGLGRRRGVWRGNRPALRPNYSGRAAASSLRRTASECRRLTSGCATASGVPSGTTSPAALSQTETIFPW